MEKAIRNTVISKNILDPIEDFNVSFEEQQGSSKLDRKKIS